MSYKRVVELRSLIADKDMQPQLCAGEPSIKGALPRLLAWEWPCCYCVVVDLRACLAVWGVGPSIKRALQGPWRWVALPMQHVCMVCSATPLSPPAAWLESLHPSLAYARPRHPFVLPRRRAKHVCSL